MLFCVSVSYSDGKIRKLVEIGKLDRFVVFSDEEEPVAAPGYIANNSSVTRHIDGDTFLVPITRNVRDSDGPIGIQFRLDRADDGFDPVRSRRRGPGIRVS